MQILSATCVLSDTTRASAHAAEHSTRPRRALEAYPAGILAFVRRSSPLDHQPGLARLPALAVPFVPSTFTLESTRKSMGESGQRRPSLAPISFRPGPTVPSAAAETLNELFWGGSGAPTPARAYMRCAAHAALRMKSAGGER